MPMVSAGRGKSAKNILVVGASGSGKTTLINAILDELERVAPDDRIISIEDSPSLLQMRCGELRQSGRGRRFNVGLPPARACV
jgi:ABC-type lipoprotein export system ATPase subunit